MDTADVRPCASGGQKQRVCLARALYAETDFFIFDDILSSLDKDTEMQVFRNIFGRNGLIKRRGATAVLCTHAIEHLPSSDHVLALKDGINIEQGSFKKLVSTAGYVSSLRIPMQDSPKTREPSTGSAIGDGTAPLPTEQRLKPTTDRASQRAGRDAKEKPTPSGNDRSIYKHYYSSIGFWPVAAFLAASAAVGFFYTFQSIWLNFWSTGITSQPATHSNTYYLLWFALMQIIGLAVLFVAAVIVLRWIISLSGATLHKDALDALFHAPLRLFSVTDTGVITNLFLQDMTLIDGELPLAMINLVVGVATCMGMAAVIATSSPYVASTYPFLIGFLFILQRFYLRTSKQLRLLGLEAKSPM